MSEIETCTSDAFCNVSLLMSSGHFQYLQLNITQLKPVITILPNFTIWVKPNKLVLVDQIEDLRIIPDFSFTPLIYIQIMLAVLYEYFLPLYYYMVQVTFLLKTDNWNCLIIYILPPIFTLPPKSIPISTKRTLRIQIKPYYFSTKIFQMDFHLTQRNSQNLYEI